MSGIPNNFAGLGWRMNVQKHPYRAHWLFYLNSSPNSVPAYVGDSGTLGNIIMS